MLLVVEFVFLIILSMFLDFSCILKKFLWSLSLAVLVIVIFCVSCIHVLTMLLIVKSNCVHNRILTGICACPEMVTKRLKTEEKKLSSFSDSKEGPPAVGAY